MPRFLLNHMKITQWITLFKKYHRNIPNLGRKNTGWGTREQSGRLLFSERTALLLKVKTEVYNQILTFPEAIVIDIQCIR